MAQWDPLGLGRLWIPWGWGDSGSQALRAGGRSGPAGSRSAENGARPLGRGSGSPVSAFCTALCPGAEPGAPETAHSWVLRVCAQPAREGDGS